MTRKNKESRYKIREKWLLRMVERVLIGVRKVCFGERGYVYFVESNYG